MVGEEDVKESVGVGGSEGGVARMAEGCFAVWWNKRYEYGLVADDGRRVWVGKAYANVAMVKVAVQA